MENIVLIRSNSINVDTRVNKIINSLSKKYNVTILGWDRELKYKKIEIYHNSLLIRYKRKALYGNISTILYYPLYWFWIFRELIRYHPKIMHTCDFDTIIPVLIYKKLFKKIVIFDSFDRYAMAFISIKNPLYKIVNKLEEICSKNCNALITVSEERLSSFGSYKPKICQIIMNCSEDKLKNIKEIDLTIDLDKNKFLLVYPGLISKDVGLLLISDAIKKIDNIELILIGKIFDSSYSIFKQNKKIKYYGILNRDDALKLMSVADAVPILYNPDIPNNQLANPNKLFECMMLGVPFFTNVCKDIIKSNFCGLLTEYNSINIYEIILKLKNDPDLKHKLGENGRDAFKKKYNWEIMEKKLFELYNKLI